MVEEEQISKISEEQISKISSVTLRKCLESDCHYGTTSKNHNYSKMSSFVYERKNGIYIFDLNKTIEKMKEVYNEVYNLTRSGGKIIFVANKNTRAKEEIKNDAIRSGSFFVINRWLGGTFTNFSSIKMAIKKLKMMEKNEENGSVKDLKKKEQVIFFRNKQKMLKNLEGIKEMIKIPQAIFVTNSNQRDLKVIKEARDKGIKVFAIVNTNNNPDIVDYFIPASNSSPKSIKFISNLIADAIVEARCEIKSDKFKKDPNDISMNEVIKNVEKKIAEKISAIRAAKEKKQDLFMKKMQFRRDLFERKKREISENENSSKNEKNVLSNQEQLSVKKNDNKEEKLDDNKKEEKKIKIKSSKKTSDKKIVNKSKDDEIKKENDENIKKKDNKSVIKTKIKKHKKTENKKG